jgi:2'-5' RNA ligase
MNCCASKSDNVSGYEVRKRRLFFALWPATKLQEQMLCVTRGLVDRSGGRPVRAENLHVTLAFLGAVPGPELGRIKAIGALLRAPPFALVLDRVESWVAADVLCLTPTEESAELSALAVGLRFSLLAQQVDLSSQEFRPHVTLARHLRGQIAAQIEPILYPVSEVALVESQHRGQGSDYQILARWPLPQETV